MSKTFKAAGETGWAQIVDGKDFSRFGVQLDCSMPVLLCIATDAPAANSQDFMFLDHGGTREIICSIGAGDKVFIKTAAAIDVAVRGFKENR